jgi:hypothetical protein
MQCPGRAAEESLREVVRARQIEIAKPRQKDRRRASRVESHASRYILPEGHIFA